MDTVHDTAIQRQNRISTNTYYAVDNSGVFIGSVTLAIVFLSFGAMKFTAHEANAIIVFVENSPLLSWVYMILTPMQFSYLLGVIEIFTGVFLALRLISPAAGAVGALMATVTYVITFSFFFTTPGVLETTPEFTALSTMPGQFLLKDLALLGLSIYLLKNAMRAVNQRYNEPQNL